MVKNRKVLVIFLVLTALLVGVMLCAFLFKVRDFDMQYLSQPNFKLETDYGEATGAYAGKSVLFFNPGDLRRDIEEKYPYARVESVDKNVSSTVVVKLTERYEYFCLRMGTEYAVLDGELKVLRRGEGEPATFDGVDKLVDVILPDGAVLSARPGETAAFEKEYIPQFLRAFVGEIESYAGNEFVVRQNFASVDLTFVRNIEVTGRFGCTFRLLSPERDFSAFAGKMFEVFYEKFDTELRETARASLQFSDGKIKTVW